MTRSFRQIRQESGANMKPSRYADDYILCEYDERADYTLADIRRIQTVRAV